jgi:hypothetical protein
LIRRQRLTLSFPMGTATFRTCWTKALRLVIGSWFESDLGLHFRSSEGMYGPLADGLGCLADHPLSGELSLEARSPPLRQTVGGTIQRYRRTEVLKLRYAAPNRRPRERSSRNTTTWVTTSTTGRSSSGQAVPATNANST